VDSSVSRLQMRVVALCGLVVLLDGLDTQVIGYLGPALASEWSIPRAALGPVFSASLVGLMTGLLVIGPLSDRIGRKRVMIAATLAFGLLTLLTANAHGVTELIVYRILAGIGLGGALPNALALTGEFCPPRRRATLVVLMFCGFSLGSILGGGLTAALISQYGWRPIFLAGGALPLLLAPVLIALLPESPQFLARTGSRAHPGVPVAELFQDGRGFGTALIWIAFFMNLLDFYFLQNWLPTIFTGSGLSIETAVLVTTLVSAGGIAAGLATGPLMDRFGGYRVLAVLYAAGALFVALIGITVSSLPLLMAGTFAAGFCVSGGQKSINALAVIFYPPAMRSTGVGWALGVGRTGAILGPVMGGWLLSRGWSNVGIFALGALPMLCACAVMLQMGNRYGSTVEAPLAVAETQ
jgi:AAHS family 4-hydroxybenzoate transporter-like MFS transporter